MNNKRIFIIFEILVVITAVIGAVMKNPFFIMQSLLIGSTVIAVYFGNRRFNLFSESVYRLVMLFVFLSMYVGKIFSMYEIIVFWDKILHFLSGLILVKLGIDIYRKMGGAKIKNLENFFAFIFAAACAGIWEIYEFTTDFLFSLTSQQNSLIDTMLDIICGCASALIFVIIMHFAEKKSI